MSQNMIKEAVWIRFGVYVFVVVISDFMYYYTENTERTTRAGLIDDGR